MVQAMPQEIEVWYVIPALRKELSKILVHDHSLSQKNAAKLLGITEPAISQYLNDKRGQEIKFEEGELAKIKKTADKIIKDPSNVMAHMYNLTVELRGSKSVCELHKKQDKSLPNDCKICMC